ncbi:MAG: CAP domain-containing protein [Rhizobiaceae bacterium]|nr:CAP domain-containing protein [Rhizobiaceae bacterium]
MKILPFLFASLLLVTLSACSPTSVFDRTKPETLGSPIDQTIVSFTPDHAFQRLNDTRRGYFLGGFKRDERLMEAARRHAELMGRTGKFGHDIGPGTQFKSRIFAVGFDNSAGENLGVGYKSIDEAIEGWLNSPGHRKILLKRNYSLGGIAYAPNTSGKNPRLNHFWVLIVGRE